MNIALIASEAAPYAKTGGLADVAGALPKYLTELGHSVKVVLPFYRQVRAQSQALGLSVVLSDVPIDWAGSRQTFRVWHGQDPGCSMLFIERDEYFDREGLYGSSQGDFPDNGFRFAFFCRAALEALKAMKDRVDVLHSHDWQSALALAYKKHNYGQDPFWSGTKTLFTIHNLAYQGLFAKEIVPGVGLPEFLFNMEDLEFHGRVNYLKAGLLYSDAISTVSRKYSQEIQTPEFGCGLDGLLRKRSTVLHGILNGVDYAAWNPETDRFIAARYKPKAFVQAKARCKKDLLGTFGLPVQARGLPLAGMVSRLAGQKGLDILLDALEELVRMGLCLVVLGLGDELIEKALTAAVKKYPSQVSVKLAFDEALAHKVYAGSDLFLIPSRYEPCGLTQMYSLKYGAIPVVRATGGLDDTIQEFNARTGRGNGFKFRDYSASALVEAVRKALTAHSQKEAWRALIRNAMNADYSWTRSAEEYIKLYRSL